MGVGQRAFERPDSSADLDAQVDLRRGMNVNVNISADVARD
jgi:hypothetical protein